MTLKHLPASSFRRMPWKNGGGETIEIAVWPEGAGFDDFLWRISMARVDGPGPFSRFPGIDRTLCVLEGGALSLDFEGRGTLVLDEASPPYSFPADIAVSGRISGASLTDLNVMTRRGAARHHVSKLRVDRGEISLRPLGSILMVLTLGPGVTLRLGDAVARLSPGDAALAHPAEVQALVLNAETAGEVFVIDLWS